MSTSISTNLKILKLHANIAAMQWHVEPKTDLFAKIANGTPSNQTRSHGHAQTVSFICAFVKNHVKVVTQRGPMEAP